MASVQNRYNLTDRSSADVHEQRPARMRSPRAAMRARAGRVAVELDNLVALSEELCADTMSLSDGTVTFTRRGPAGVVRWQGVVGRRGLLRL